MSMNCAPTIIKLNSGHLQARIPLDFPVTVEVLGANPPDSKNIGGGGGGDFRVWTSVNKYDSLQQTLIFKNNAGEVLNCAHDADGIFAPPAVSNGQFQSVTFDTATRKLTWVMAIQLGIVSYDVLDDGVAIANIPAVSGQTQYDMTLGLFSRGQFCIVANGEDGHTFNSNDQGKCVVVS